MRYRQPYTLILALGLCACDAGLPGSGSGAPPDAAAVAASRRAQEFSPTAAVPAVSAPQAALSPDEIFATRSKSVWLLATFRLNADGKGLTPIGSGSAVAVTANTLLTSCQNLQGADVAGLRQTGAVQRATFQGPAPPEGICRLTVADQLPDPAPTRTYDDVTLGERVYAIDRSRSPEPSFGEGTVAGKEVTSHGALLGTNAPVPKGASGGGLFDGQGRLVGIISALVRGGEQLNAADAITSDLVPSAVAATPPPSATGTASTSEAPAAAAAPAPQPAPASPAPPAGGDPLATLLNEQAGRFGKPASP